MTEAPYPSMQSEFAASIALSSAGLISLQCATRTEWSGPSSFSCQEVKEAVQLGKFGEQIVVLPDVGLQQPAMIGSPIQNVRGRQAVATDLVAEIL